MPSAGQKIPTQTSNTMNPVKMISWFCSKTQQQRVTLKNYPNNLLEDFDRSPHLYKIYQRHKVFHPTLTIREEQQQNLTA